MKWTRAKAGRYATVSSIDGTEYLVWKHDGLTWQDPAYWLVDVNGQTIKNEQGRNRRFRTLAEAKAWVVTAERGGE